MMYSEEIKTAIKEAAMDTECRFSDDYSGRGMYGARCVSISGEPDALWETCMAAQMQLAESDIMLRPPRRDSMGLGEVWYWPGLRTQVPDAS